MSKSRAEPAPTEDSRRRCRESSVAAEPARLPTNIGRGRTLHSCATRTHITSNIRIVDNAESFVFGKGLKVFLMMLAPETAVRLVVAFGLALTGGAISTMGAISHRRLCALISLAAGTLMGVTLFSILPEAARTASWPQLILAFGSGYLLFSLISRYVFHVCPACAASHFDEATTHRFGEIAAAMMIALAVHSSLDGVAVTAGREAGGPLSASLMLAVSVHKLPEGLALGGLLLGAGFRRAQVVGWVAAVESTTLFGGLLGGWLLPGVTLWLDLVLAHVGGGFLFLAVHAVFGELLKHGKRLVLVSFATGLAIIGLLIVAMRA
jgi:zinc transporter ZupT